MLSLRVCAFVQGDERRQTGEEALFFQKVPLISYIPTTPGKRVRDPLAESFGSKPLIFFDTKIHHPSGISEFHLHAQCDTMCTFFAFRIYVKHVPNDHRDDMNASHVMCGLFPHHLL
jgi:hypothetical protein